MDYKNKGLGKAVILEKTPSILYHHRAWQGLFGPVDHNYPRPPADGINGLAGLVKCKTKDRLGLRHLSTEVSRAKELTKGVINWCLSYQSKVRGNSSSL